MAQELRLALLGGLEITRASGPVTGFVSGKAQALLSYLAVTGQPHLRPALAGLLWSDMPEAVANTNLRQALSNLRKLVGGHLTITPQSVAFDRSSCYWLDVEVFYQQVEQALRQPQLPTPETVGKLAQAVALYRGDLLSGFYVRDAPAFEEWVLEQRERLRELAVQAWHVLTLYYAGRGENAQAIAYAARLLATDPWREEMHRQMMLLLARSGQRSAALAQYKTCRQALAQEMGIEPTAETTALYERIRAASVRNLHLPPQPTPFVGRQDELARIACYFDDPACRLLTLVGPGGIGKTRLAIQVAAARSEAFLDGIYFVPLADVTLPESLAQKVADVLGLSACGSQPIKEQLIGFLCEKELLLLLDNFEHLLQGAELLLELLHGAPRLKLLVTSRARLNLRWEWVMDIQGLPYPASHEDSRIEEYSATQLFSRSANRIQPNFDLAKEGSFVARICRLVEGMPLALELVAAWVAVRSCQDIAQDLERNLDVLTARQFDLTERHRSIYATFEHSWKLLSPAERNLFARLSVFRGGFRFEAAEAVAGASLSTLAALVDKSLVRHSASGRYDLHELLRQYAAEKLEALPPEQEKTQTQHARYFAAFMCAQGERLLSKHQKQALAEMDAEMDNARQAWHWAIQSGSENELEQSLDSLYNFYDIRSRFQEGVELLGQATAPPSKDRLPQDLLAKLLARQGALYSRLALCEQARACLEQSLAIFERSPHPTERIFCQVALANVALQQGRRDEAAQLAQQSLSLSREVGYAWGEASSLYLQGLIHYRAGQVQEARTLVEASLAVGRQSGNPRLLSAPINTLGDIACHQGDFASAQSLFEEHLALSRELGDQYNVALHLNNLGTISHSLNKYDEAQTLYQESLDICRRTGDRRGQAIALSNMGEIAFAVGAYQEAVSFYRQVISIGRSTRNQWTLMAGLNNLGEVMCALGDASGARVCLAEAMHIAVETHTLTMVMKVLVNLGILFAQQGQTDRAAELFELARHHPASERGIQKKAERLLDEMGLDAPASRSLDSIVAEISAIMTSDLP